MSVVAERVKSVTNNGAAACSDQQLFEGVGTVSPVGDAFSHRALIRGEGLRNCVWRRKLGGGSGTWRLLVRDFCQNVVCAPDLWDTGGRESACWPRLLPPVLALLSAGADESAGGGRGCHGQSQFSLDLQVPGLAQSSWETKLTPLRAVRRSG